VSRDAFKKAADELESAGYVRGYRAAIRDLRVQLNDMLARLTPAVSAEEDRVLFRAEPLEVREHKVRDLKTIVRSRSDQQRVYEAILAQPGLRGMELVRKLGADTPPIQERTVRTALSRLKDRKMIEQHDGGWHVRVPDPEDKDPRN
jgi:hypothetical protein